MMVSFWVLSKTRHLVFMGPKQKEAIIFLLTHVILSKAVLRG